jgi:two-component system, chemotaxis family, chemotaxis protein CheY
MMNSDKTVVIADDSVLARYQIREFFEQKLGFKVLAEAENGEEAFEQYKNWMPSLITVDINMPMENGISAIRKIMNFHPEANIIVVSAIRNSEKMTEVLKLGPKGYIKKPLEFHSVQFSDDFCAEVENAVHQKRSSDSSNK